MTLSSVTGNSRQAPETKMIVCETRLCLTSSDVGWIQSVPPRGSGWVRRRHFRNINKIEHVYDVPTRYREVVLTVSKSDSDI